MRTRTYLLILLWLLVASVWFTYWQVGKWSVPPPPTMQHLPYHPRHNPIGQLASAVTPYPVAESNLKVWYDGYNEDYFLNQLPRDTTVRYGAVAENISGETFKDGANHFIILISPHWNPTSEEVRMTLLHEMAHIDTWGELGHGEKWHAEMRRLAAAGAFDDIW